jgi:hypothetical protein
MKRNGPIQTQALPVWSLNLPYWTRAQQRRARPGAGARVRMLRALRPLRRQRATPGS